MIVSELFSAPSISAGHAQLDAGGAKRLWQSEEEEQQQLLEFSSSQRAVVVDR